MTQHHIQLLAIDLDGTTLMHKGDRFFFTPRVEAAVKGAISKGVKVAIATGRGVFATREYAQQLGTNAPSICHQGGTIHDFSDERTLLSITLSLDLACELAALEKDHPGWHATMYRGEDVFITSKRYDDYFYDLVAKGPIIHPDLCAALDGQEPDKVLFILEAHETADALAQITAFVGDRGVVVQSHALFVEVNPSGVHKGAGLRWLADKLGVAREQVMAIGDQGNDASMIEWAGLGVAMGNANPISKAVADWIAPSIDEDGAAVAIEKYILHRQAAS